MKKLFIFIFLSPLLLAKSYDLYLASTKYEDVAIKYYNDIKFHTPDFYNTVIRIHKNKSYSVIVKDIPTLEETRKIEKLFHLAKKYKDSYIKTYNTKSSYNILKVNENNSTKVTKKSFNQDIENSNEYITASIMFNTGKYDRAYEMFYKLFLKDTYNKNINYFLARSAFNLKKYDEATAAYERVLIAEPNFNQARYDYARILFKLKQKDEAEKEFKKLLKTNINKKTKKDIKEFLSVLSKKNKKVNGTANIMLGLLTSSNVNNGLISPEYTLPGLNDIVVEGEKPISDSAHFEALNLIFYNYFKDKPLRLKNSFLAYNKNYFNEKDENITVLSYKPALDYIYEKNIYGIEFSFDKIIKRTEDDFYSLSLSPKFRNKNFLTYLRYQKIMYEKDINKEKDFEKIQLFSKINLFKNMNFYTNLSRNQRIHEERIDINKYTIGNGLNLFYDLNEKNQINLNYQFDYSKYMDKSFAFDNKREDKNHLINLSYKYFLDKTNIINLSASYVKNNSNQKAYEYDKSILQLNYLKGFNW